MNSQPIYSADLSKEEHKNIRDLVPKIISQDNVDKLNSIVSIIPHGIFVFVQYQEKSFIVNGYPEQLFWDNIIRLYSLLHDCGQQTIELFLKPRTTGGLEALNIFQPKEEIENGRFDAALSLIGYIDALRHSKTHNFKPESKTDQLKLEKCKRWFLEACSEDFPSNQNKWTRCNKYLVKAADDIYEILNARLTYFKNNCTEMQKEWFLNEYYEKCGKHLSASMFKAFQDVNKIYRLNMNPVQINATIKCNEERILTKAVQLIQRASRRVDPYKALIETITIETVRR